MAKSKTTTTAAADPAQPETIGDTVNSIAHSESSGAADQPNSQPEGKPITQIDPFPIQAILLGATNDSPKMRLLRSNQFQQMQIRFDEKPAETHLAKLRDSGWKWRSSEQAWTIQLDREARWKTQADAERIFRDVANAIRTENGLETLVEVSR